MIKVTILQNKNQEYRGFRCEGHAGYAEAGSDIVCAAVSVLVTNTVNSIDELTDDDFSGEIDEENAVIALEFNDVPSREAKLLMDSLVLGMEGICQEQRKYVKLTFKEV